MKPIIGSIIIEQGARFFKNRIVVILNERTIYHLNQESPYHISKWEIFEHFRRLGWFDMLHVQGIVI